MSRRLDWQRLETGANGTRFEAEAVVQDKGEVILYDLAVKQGTDSQRCLAWWWDAQEGQTLMMDSVMQFARTNEGWYSTAAAARRAAEEWFFGGVDTGWAEE